MKDAIHNLYANPNFPLYLGIVIIVLLGTFFVVYLLGKKDKEKLEETKRLEKVTEDAFKEVTAPVDPAVTKENTLNNNPSFEDKKIEMPPVIENVNISKPAEIEMLTIPNEEKVDKPVIEKTDILVPVTNESIEEKTPELQPIIPDIIKLPNEEDSSKYKAFKSNYEQLTNSIDNDLKEMENKVAAPVLNEEIEPPLSVPYVTEEPINDNLKTQPENNTKVSNEVFSSVYSPKKEPVLFDDTLEIELPRLK